MNKHTYFLILTSLLVATMSATAGIEPGDKAPAFTLQGADGNSHKLSNYDGMYIVLEWLNYSCPQVQKNYDSGNMQAAQKKQTAEGVVWLSILSSVPREPGYTPQEEALKAAAEHGSDATEILLDPTGAVGKAYGATLTPEILIIDPKGKVFYRGAFDSTRSTASADIKEITNYVNLAIAEAKAGTPVSQAKTEPDGCVINYLE